MSNVTFLAIFLMLITAFNCYGQIAIPSQVARPITPIIDTLPGELTRIRETVKTPIDTTLANASSLLEKASDPLYALPDAITIKQSNGAVELKEIKTPDGFLAIEKEWVLVAKEADIKALSHPDIQVVKKRYLQTIGQWMYTLSITASLERLSEIRDSLPVGLRQQLTRNYVYLSQTSHPLDTSGRQIESASSFTSSSPSSHTERAKSGVKACSIASRVGMIDTPIFDSHDAFTHIDITQKNFLAKSLANNNVHGTAVAGILAQRLASNSLIFNASVFYERSQVSQGATLANLLEGLNYLAEQHVDAINMSLSGPDNDVLRAALAAIDKQGIQVIAAAGNNGPAAPAAYPAAYLSTIAVTAVDSDHQIYRWANQGNYIDFSALGVSVETAHPTLRTSRESGTSMAAPIITANYACALRHRAHRGDALASLIEASIDMGKEGRDAVFGYGCCHNIHGNMSSLKQGCGGLKMQFHTKLSQRFFVICAVRGRGIIPVLRTQHDIDMWANRVIDGRFNALPIVISPDTSFPRACIISRFIVIR